MKYVYLANNRVGLKVLRWLTSRREDEITGLVLNAPAKQKLADEIRAASGLRPDQVFDARKLNDSEILESIKSLGADVGISVYFGHILKPEFLSLFPAGVINLHPSLLPYNRGAHSNIWSIVDRTPAGVSLHYIDPGIDTGDVLSQSPVGVLPTDTGQTLHARLEEAAAELFFDSWPEFRAGRLARQPQSNGQGSFHRAADTSKIDRIDLDSRYTGRELLNILRARTFPPFSSAYFEQNGKRYYVRVSISPEDETDD